MESEVKTRAERARIARAAGQVSSLTLVSRLLGLVREVVFAALLGAGFYSDAFRIPFRIPNLLRDMFAEGALSSAFGLVGYSGVKVLAPAFYAVHQPRWPLLASSLAVATNLAVAFVLFPRIGFKALALGTALASLVNAVLLAANLVTGLLPVLIGVAVYALLTRGLRVAEAEALWSLVRQRFERNP